MHELDPVEHIALPRKAEVTDYSAEACPLQGSTPMSGIDTCLFRPDGARVPGSNESEWPKPWRDAIDVHHHVLPDFYFDELAELGSDLVLPGADRPRWTVHDSLDAMDRHGVRAAVVNVWPGVPMTSPSAALRLARMINDYLADLVAAHPGRFGAFAVLPLPHVDEALDELKRALEVLGLDGVGMVSHVQGHYPGDPLFEPVLAELDRRRAPIFVHPAPPPSTGQPTFGLPASVCEFPFETVRVATQLLYNGTLTRYPRLPVILPHGGGGVAYYAHRLGLGPQITADLSGRLLEDAKTALRRLYVDTAMVGDDTAWPAVSSFFPDSQILMGSDFPFMSVSAGLRNGHHIAAAVGTTEDQIERLEQVSRRNAKSLFPRFENPTSIATSEERA